jgi:hypothetical protein
MFPLRGDTECTECDGEGCVEVDTTRSIDWEPSSKEVACESCDGCGYVEESPSDFITRAVQRSPSRTFRHLPLATVELLQFMAERMADAEDFDRGAREVVARKLGHQHIHGAL